MPTSAQLAFMSGLAAAAALLWRGDHMLALLSLSVLLALLGFAALVLECVQLCREIDYLSERIDRIAKDWRQTARKNTTAQKVEKAFKLRE